MRETRPRVMTMMRVKPVERGFAMAFVFVLIALLLLIAILVVTGAFNAVDQAQAVGVKYGVMNSAEAAANLALNQLAENPNEPIGCVTGSLNGMNYRSCMGYNNLYGQWAEVATDYANGQPLWVPKGTAYIYGESTNNGSRKVYVEAIAEPAPPLTMPSGVVNAAQNINDLAPEPIKQDPLHTNDANIAANNNITMSSAPSTVQGSTQAVGTDALNTGTTNTSGASPVYFPSTTQVTQAAQNARLIAQAGTTVSGGTVSSAGTATYSGNVYVNGSVDITSGTVTFTSGSDVYINGNLCISGTGSVLNTDAKQGVMVVTGVVSSSGTGGYAVTLPANTLLIALGNDPGSINPCGGGAADALSFAPSAGVEPVATAFAPNGSVGIWGAGTVQGAFDGGINVDIDGGSGSAILYDAGQANTTMTTGTMTYTAYNQD